jgi:hypothetical protein
MRLRLLLVVTSAVLLFTPRTASALGLDSQPGGGVSASVLMQQNANESAQATTDMPLHETAQGTDIRPQGAENVSYGGVPAGQSEAGGGYGRPCGAGPQCRIYFGR